VSKRQSHGVSEAGELEEQMIFPMGSTRRLRVYQSLVQFFIEMQHTPVSWSWPEATIIGRLKPRLAKILAACPRLVENLLRWRGTIPAAFYAFHRNLKSLSGSCDCIQDVGGRTMSDEPL